MHSICKIILFAFVILFGSAGFLAEPAQAQATRTWVSGVGDDANPCSRTAPCKTFAGAISKTAAGGEINCLDPGGFGAVTITKTITISCPYTEGGLLAAGNGIIVNAGATDVVTLRGLDIFGVNPPTNGVRFIAGAALHIEDSVIRRFNSATSHGVAFQPGGSSRLYITNTTITDNGNGTTGGGILIQPTGAAGGARVHLRDVRVNNNTNIGLRIDTTGFTNPFGISVVVENCSFSGNVIGIFINTPTATPLAVLLVSDTAISNHTNIGISAAGSASRVRVANSDIHGNANGLLISSGAVINTYGNNRLDGNGTDGTFTLPPIPED
jgi:hypothetical protein